MEPLPSEVYHFSLWSLAILLVGAASFSIPMLRSIGQGFQYGKLALPLGMISVTYSLQTQWFALVYIVILYVLLKAAKDLLFQLSLDPSEMPLAWDKEQLSQLSVPLKKSADPLVIMAL